MQEEKNTSDARLTALVLKIATETEEKKKQYQQQKKGLFTACMHRDSSLLLCFSERCAKEAFEDQDKKLACVFVGVRVSDKERYLRFGGDGCGGANGATESRWLNTMMDLITVEILHMCM